MKPRLLISAPGHHFFTWIGNELSVLSDHYELTIVVFSICEIDQSLLRDKLFELIKGKTRVFFIGPESDDTFSRYLRRIKSVFSQIRKKIFTYWITFSQLTLEEQLIDKLIINHQTKCFIYWPGITYAQIQEELMIKAFGEEYVSDRLFNRYPISPLSLGQSKYPSWLKKLLRPIYYVFRNFFFKLKKIKSFIIKKVYVYIFFQVFLRAPNKLEEQLHISAKFKGKLIFCDEEKVSLHQHLLNSSDIFCIKRQFNGLKKQKNNKVLKRQILSPLSGFLGLENVSESYLDHYYNSFVQLKMKYDFDVIHLRPHPRETGEWPKIFMNYLIERGLNVSLIDASTPLHEIFHEYIGVAGFASNVLLDAKAFCKNIFIVAFEAISTVRFKNPKLVFSPEDNIHWLNADGSFEQNKLGSTSVGTTGKTLIDILRG